MPKVHEFAIAPGLTETTEFPTQRRSSAESPANYRFTFSTLATYLESLFAIKRVRGIYYDDAAASAGGVQIGQVYELAQVNKYGLPKGILKTRRE